jgi:hypothetical protein
VRREATGPTAPGWRVDCGGGRVGSRETRRDATGQAGGPAVDACWGPLPSCRRSRRAAGDPRAAAAGGAVGAGQPALRGGRAGGGVAGGREGGMWWAAGLASRRRGSWGRAGTPNPKPGAVFDTPKTRQFTDGHSTHLNRFDTPKTRQFTDGRFSTHPKLTSWGVPARARGGRGGIGGHQGALAIDGQSGPAGGPRYISWKMEGGHPVGPHHHGPQQRYILTTRGPDPAPDPPGPAPRRRGRPSPAPSGGGGCQKGR